MFRYRKHGEAVYIAFVNSAGDRDLADRDMGQNRVDEAL